MNSKNLNICLLCLLLSACATQPETPETIEIPVQDNPDIMLDPIIQRDLLDTPDLSRFKAGKRLQLVRAMEGGACKNDQQGAVGLFELYANADDIERIKQTQGAEVFADFELRIQDFSMHALQYAVQQLNYPAAANLQNDNEVQQQLAAALSALFIESVANDVTQFETETTLSIDVIPANDSFLVYLDGCSITHK